MKEEETEVCVPNQEKSGNVNYNEGLRLSKRCQRGGIGLWSVVLINKGLSG